ncbi:MAG TPA: hypothetical protein VIK25_02685 [Gemmatimonadaceae bacterium]
MCLARIRFALPGLLALAVQPLLAQARLKSMPGYDRYTLMAPKLSGAVKSGRVNVQWAEDGKSFGFTRDGKRSDVQVGPDAGHSALSMERMMEFFIESLVLDKGPAGSLK